MLQAIDQWAFQILFALYGLLGIQDIPREPSPDWTVVERWVEQPDKRYRLVIESESLAEQCRGNPKNYIIFPQTYMAQQEVYVDEQIVYTNSVSEKWNLSSVFNRPVISCRLVSSTTKKILFKVDANIQFFMGIRTYPIIKNYYPVFSFFYDSIYLVAAAVCICLAVIGAILMRKLGTTDSLTVIIFRDTLLALLMISYVPGYFFDADIKYFHYLMGVTLTCGFLFLIKPIFFDRAKNSIFISMFIGNTIFWSLLFDKKNALQMAAIIYCFLFIAILVAANIKIYYQNQSRYKFSRLECFTYFLILVLAAQDLYIADISREGYYHLSLLIIIISISNFFRVVREVQSKNAENATIKEKLKNENVVIDTLSAMHELYKEVIHDLKAPVTALNFIAKNNDGRGSGLGQITERFNEVLSKIERGENIKSSDWYLFGQLTIAIDKVIEEKINLTKNVKVHVNHEDKDTEVFFNPVDMKVIISELIDNSIKNSTQINNLIISISLKMVDGDRLYLSVTDNGPGVSSDRISMLGQKGFSTSGGGTGLYSLVKRAESFGGRVKFENAGGLRCTIMLKVRSLS
jgi:signal transduction histidine kinase